LKDNRKGKKNKSYDTAKEKVETAVIIAVEEKMNKNARTDEFLDELEFLTLTAGATTVERFVQKLSMPEPRTYVGSGKLEEIAAFVVDNDIDLAVFDDELSPSQIRNLEEKLRCKIIDRSALILDIFARNAKTARARNQVELAQSEYLLPRLTGLWTHLEKQRGGIGMKGPGEKEIETDRRVIRDKIALLRKRLNLIDKQSVTQRKNRSGQKRVAIVGYTNVGKSTLMNILSKAGVKAENKLFATLDSTVRKVVVRDEEDDMSIPYAFLLSDTVGFIRKLPHQLVESFKSTLDEVIEADVLMHVVDISHSQFEEQMSVVNETLVEIGAGDKPVILVFNKIDSYHPVATSNDIFEDEAIYDLADLKRSWLAKVTEPVVFISAKDKTNISELRSVLFKELQKIY
jgi:GTPase